MVRIPTHRKPTHPGEMLREEFLAPMNISQRELADAIHVPYQRINELVNQKRGGNTQHSITFSKVFWCFGWFLVKYSNALRPL